jgi:O-antigen/teichoic acid export membrane protein
VAAAGVVTWTAVGVLFYGVYLLTSIGLNITGRTKYYPVTTAMGAAVNIALNFLLIPRFGMIGAAWANAAAYALQAALALGFSQRFYPVAYEYGRLSRAVGAALVGYIAARALPAMSPLLGVLTRGGTVVTVMATLLWMTRFFNADELSALNSLRLRQGAAEPGAPAETTERAGEIIAVDVPEAPTGRPNRPL